VAPDAADVHIGFSALGGNLTRSVSRSRCGFSYR
jgi:hypothetical protein